MKAAKIGSGCTRKGKTIKNSASLHIIGAKGKG
jgi:hypothetical protein